MWESTIADVVRISLTGGKRRPATVALNKSPALVLSGNEPPAESSPLLLIDFLRPSFISLNVTLWCNDFDEDAGDTLEELPLSALGDNPTRFSGFCKGRFNIWVQLNNRNCKWITAAREIKFLVMLLQKQKVRVVWQWMSESLLAQRFKPITASKIEATSAVWVIWFLEYLVIFPLSKVA